MGYYQERDRQITNYRMFRLGGTGLSFRGPEPKTSDSGAYFTCLGAAQTFGCFCDRPYPTLLESGLDLPVLNLGYGGAGPAFFLKHSALIDYINRSRFAIVQVMSGRSESNSLFETGGLEYLKWRSDGRQMGSEPAYQELLETRDRDFVRMVVAETRRNWVTNYQLLLTEIRVPKILFWFSERGPDYHETFDNIYCLFGKFPHLINRDAIAKIKPFCDDYIECISDRGMPQLLIDRFTGDPTPLNLAYQRPDLGDKTSFYNNYYCAPEMQRDAAKSLISACKKYV